MSTLEAGLRHAQRVHAVKNFEVMLAQNLREPDWQKWFQSNSWVLGSQFVRILDERHIDVQRISDFLMEAYDGFLDVVEIKRPEGGMSFWSSTLDHGNYVPSTELTKAVAGRPRVTSTKSSVRPTGGDLKKGAITYAKERRASFYPTTATC
jgi:hypothetical protein